ncbi:hypothetical protein SAMN05443428_10975 [Caloramator quimbayensis]|uniref:DUF6873 domain-containing protein n=1 Tax=Caloramator quimbayensis TaxID=1147123 RepID=A0A1T4XHW2_9CLOT|nr:hypothetical protein [Caloramator quimbayensis]SKA89106.1 hypothetical protein SAMN05443428_10975 [Caloramator quimbayensis]
MMENYVEIPNLPENNISLAVVDGRIPCDMEKILYGMNIKLIKTKKIKNLYDAISYHPDIMLHHIGGRDIVAAPDTDNSIIYQLEDEGFNIIFGKKKLSEKYPFDIAYNAARIGNFLFCNKKHTDEVLLEEAEKRNLNLIDIKQGYAKCSLCIADNNAVITFDRGIKEKLDKYDIDNLIITPGYIDLFNFSYGFIGGASGKLSKDKIAFFGNAKLHPDYDKIYLFLLKNRKKIINLSENKMVDLGTLIPLKEYSILMQ